MHACVKIVDKVFDTRWWMCQYGAPTPKRHYAYSNSDKIYLLNQGKLYVKCAHKGLEQYLEREISRERSAIQGPKTYVQRSAPVAVLDRFGLSGLGFQVVWALWGSIGPI